MLPTDYGERCICKRCFHMLKRSLTGVSREPRAALALFTSGTKASLFLKLTLFLFSPNNADSRHPQTTAASHSQQSTTINAIRQTNTNTAIMRFLLKIMMALMAMITVSAALPAAVSLTYLQMTTSADRSRRTTPLALSPPSSPAMLLISSPFHPP